MTYIEKIRNPLMDRQFSTFVVMTMAVFDKARQFKVCFTYELLHFPCEH